MSVRYPTRKNSQQSAKPPLRKIIFSVAVILAVLVLFLVIKLHNREVSPEVSKNSMDATENGEIADKNNEIKLVDTQTEPPKKSILVKSDKIKDLSLKVNENGRSKTASQEAQLPSDEENPKVEATARPLEMWSKPKDFRLELHYFAHVDASVIIGSLTISSKVKGCPTIRCDYKIPCDGKGRPLPSSADIIAVFPFPSENNATEGFASVLASRWGFTIFSLCFPGMEKETGDDPATYYYYPQSGSGEAYRIAAKKIRELAGFPDRNILLTGRSGGGSAAHLFANAYPGEVETVAQEAGQVFPADIQFKGPMLITHGECDHVVPKVLAFDAELSKQHAFFTRISFRPNWESRGNNDIWTHGQYEGDGPKILYAWLSDVANVRSTNHGKMPPFEKWKSDREHAFPGPLSLDIYKNMPAPRLTVSGPDEVCTIARSSPAIKPKATVILIANAFIESVEEARFDGDFLADNGFISIVGTSEKIIQKAWINLTTEEQKLPIFIVYYTNGSKLISFSKNILGLVQNVIIFGRPFDALSIKTKEPLPLITVAWPKNQNPPTLPPGCELIRFSPGENLGLNHAKRLEIIVTQIKNIFEKK